MYTGVYGISVKRVLVDSLEGVRLIEGVVGDSR